MGANTITEKILSVKAAADARAGDTVVCRVDRVLGTERRRRWRSTISSRMGGAGCSIRRACMFAMDHYPRRRSPRTRRFHDRCARSFARHGGELHEVGDGISIRSSSSADGAPGELVIGADSHTVTCGALNALRRRRLLRYGGRDDDRTDLAARARDNRGRLAGARPRGTGREGRGSTLVGELGAEARTISASNSTGAASQLYPSRIDSSSAIWPSKWMRRRALSVKRRRDTRRADRDGRRERPGCGVLREVVIDLATVTPRVALPHSPDNVVPIERAVGTPVQMVFIGTCTGGRVSGFSRRARGAEGRRRPRRVGRAARYHAGVPRGAARAARRRHAARVRGDGSR